MGHSLIPEPFAKQISDINHVPPLVGLLSQTSIFGHNLDLGWKFPTLPWEERTERSSKRGFSYLGLEMSIERKKRKNQSKIEEKQSKIEKKKKRVLWTRQYLNDVQN